MAFYDFTGANGSAIPAGLTVERGAAEIQSNRLAFTGAVPSQGGHIVSFNAAIASTKSVVVRSSQSDTTDARLIARYIDNDNYLFVQMDYGDEALKLSGFTAGSFTAYETHNLAFPFSGDTNYAVELETTATSIKVIIDAVEIVTFTTSVHNTATKAALGATSNAMTFDDLFDGNVVGSVPTLTVSTSVVPDGDGVIRLPAGSDLPVFTPTATDAEDGNISANVVVTGGDLDNRNTELQTVTFEATDSDDNTVTVTQDVLFLPVPIIEILGDVTNGITTLNTTVGRPFEVPKGRATNPDGTQVLFDPTGAFDLNTAATYTLTYAYTNAANQVGIPKTLTIIVHPQANITSTAPFSMVQKFGAETITVDGYELRRFTSPDGAFLYGFEDDVTVAATSLNLATSGGEGRVKIGEIKIPFDSLALCEKTDVKVSVTTDAPLSNGVLLIGFGDYRNGDNRCLRKDMSGTNTEVEFTIKPQHDSTIRIVNSGNGKDPTQFVPDTGQLHEWGLSSNCNIPIFMYFGSTSQTVTITDITASAVVGKCVAGKDGKLLRGRDNFQTNPFRLDDPLNKGLPDNVVTRGYTALFDPNNINTANLITTAGSDWIDVFTTEGVVIGDVCSIARVYFDPSTVSDNPFQASRVREIVSQVTYDNIGPARYVVEVDAVNNRIRMSHPAIASYNSTSYAPDTQQRIYCLVTMSAEQVSFLVGDENQSWGFSPVNAINKRDSRAQDYGSTVEVYITDEYQNTIDIIGEREFNPDRNINYGFILPQNNFIYPFDGNDLRPEQFGERIAAMEFSFPCPDYFEGTTNNATNADRNHYFVAPNKMYGTHLYLLDAEPNDKVGKYGFNRMSCHDLSQWSLMQPEFRPERPDGLTNSPKASGLSAAACIRKEELDKVYISGYAEVDVDADLTRAETAIQHMIAGYLSANQMQSNNFLTDLTDNNARTNYWTHRMYSQGTVIVNGGTGYAVGDVIHLTCANRADTDAPTIYTVQAVNGSGAITKVIVTRNGQHKANCASPTHSQYWTSGIGTGAVFNTNQLIKNSHGQGTVTAYPSGIADGGYSSTYAGAIPMGGIFTIDPRIDLRAEFRRGILADIANDGVISNRWSYEFYAVLCAIKKYGWMVCDVTSNTFGVLINDGRITDEQRLRLYNSPNFNYANVQYMRPLMTPVHNFTPTHHLDVNGLKPKLDLIGQAEMTVPNNWQDAGVDVFSPLHGYTTAYSSDTLDRTSTQPQTLSYAYTDASGNQSDIIQRTVTLQAPVLEPTITLTQTPTTPTVGQQITFTAATTNTTSVSWTATGLTLSSNTGNSVTATAVEGNYSVTATATGDGGSASDTVSGVVARPVSAFKTATSLYDEMTEGSRKVFAIGVDDGAGGYVAPSQFSGAEYVIADNINKIVLNLSLGSGIAVDGDFFIVTIDDDAVAFNGQYYHQFMLSQNGERLEPLWRRILRIFPRFKL